MKRKWLFKNLMVTSVCFGAMVLLGTGSSKAVLQSNGNEGAVDSLPNWMINARKMEELGGAMGLSESLNDNLTTNGDSNNIDVHMQKNTEYGALAILSASSYGNPGKVNDGETTTGNATGVVMKFNNEWTAASLEGGLDTYSARYRNYYMQNYVAKRGDAITETKGWHGSNSSWFFYNSPKTVGFVRGHAGIFSYSVYYDGFFGSTFSSINNRYHSRAVVVQGDGI